MQSHYPVEPFDRLAKVYDDVVARSAGFPYVGYDAVLDQVVASADVGPGLRVLELGIGTGNLARRFADSGCSIWGIDFSTQMLARAAEKVPGAILIQADLLGAWPSIGAPFDAVVSAYALHHFDLPAKVALLSRIAQQHLLPGGRIAVADIGFPTDAARQDARRRFAADWEDDEYYWAADELIAALSRQGLPATYTQVSSCAGVLTIVIGPKSGEPRTARSEP